MAGDHSMFTSKYILLRFFMFTAAAGKLVLNGKWIKQFYLLLVLKYRHSRCTHTDIHTCTDWDLKRFRSCDREICMHIQYCIEWFCTSDTKVAQTQKFYLCTMYMQWIKVR